MRKTVLLLTSMALALLLACGVVLAETVNCGDSSSTNPCLGTSGSDTLYGTPDADYIQGQGGSDKLYGFESDDQLFGDRYDSPSQDRNDRVWGGPGIDTIQGTYGGSDIVRGNAGRDGIHVAEINVDLDTGFVYRDTPNPGVDTVYGGDGPDDVFAVDGFKDVIDCGLNPSRFPDKVRFDAGLDEVANCEELVPYTLPPPPSN